MIKSNGFDGIYTVLGNSGDFWFEVRVDYPEKFFNVNRWMNDLNYEYRAYPYRVPKGVFKDSLKPYIL